MQTFPELTDDQIAEEITTWAGRLAAGEARQLDYIAEFDRREAWGGPGLLSCAHWLTWATGLGPVAARERVRVARALGDLPGVDEAFHAGRLSWSQVRAITRVSTADDEAMYVELARHTTASQLERIVRGVRRVHKIEEDAADPELAADRMRTRTSYDADGNLVITSTVPAEDGAVMLAALEQTRAELDRRRKESESESGSGVGGASAEAPEPAAATNTEALLEMSRTTLEQLAKDRPEVVRRNRSSLTVLLDPLSGWGRLRDGELLPLSSLESIGTSLTGRGIQGLRPLSSADLRLEDLGRSRREPNQALRELLGAVDGERCRFPGCTRHRKLHAHHVVYWSDGGTTDLCNMILLCSRHHTLVHQHGYRLCLAPARGLSVATPEGIPILHHPALPWGDPAALDPTGGVDATTVTPVRVESRMDLGYVVSVVLQQAA